MGLYRLRDADRSVKLAAALFLLVLGYAYFFAFLMVKTWAGLTPAAVQATYVPPPSVTDSMLPTTSDASTQPLDLSSMSDMRHTVDAQLLVQDSHIHLMIYAIVAALQVLIMLGLDWPPWWRNTMIVAAFGFGALDFSGQWLMHFGLGGFAWLTLLSGWGMSLVYVIVLVSTLKAVLAAPAGRKEAMP
ncbi:MAG: hypothetical protein AB7Q69_04645 [Gemmatimonadales bacterium]